MFSRLRDCMRLVERRCHRSHGRRRLPLMVDEWLRGCRSTHVIWAVGHAGRPEAVRELLLEGLSSQEAAALSLALRSPPVLKPQPTRCEHMLRKSKLNGDFRVARIEMSIFYAVLGVRPHTGCNRNLDIRTGQGDLGS